MPRRTYEDPRDARARRQEAFDKAMAVDERTAIAGDRLDMQRSHQEWTEAFRQAQEDARIQQRADSLALRERGVEVREQGATLDQKAFELQQSQRQAQLAELNRKLETAKKITDDTAGYFNSIEGLDPRSPEYRSRLDAITKQYPSALQAEGPQKHYSGTMSVHDKWLAERSKVPPVLPGLRLEAERLDREYFTEVAAWQKWKKDHPKEAAPNEAAIEALRAKRDEIGARIHAVNVSPQQAPESAVPAPADSRAALAQKALNDPNASEAHKAAARKILGL